MEYVQELDLPVNMRAVLAKLPYKLRERWRCRAHDIMENTGCSAGFSDMVEFIERHVKILSDPFIGDLQDYSSGTTSAFLSKLPSGVKVRRNVVASTITSADSRVQRQSFTAVEEGTSNRCICCSLEHSLEDCQQFQGKRHMDKVFLLKKRGMCFGCLRQGHISRNCEARLNCEMQTKPSYCTSH